ncbi:MAG: DUF433 domain-containing protein [Nitrospiria bacterium]
MFPKPQQSPNNLQSKGIQIFPRIARDKNIMHGQPVIKGTRIPVLLIFDYLADGYLIKDLLKLFPHLTPKDINEALRYGSKVLQK